MAASVAAPVVVVPPRGDLLQRNPHPCRVEGCHFIARCKGELRSHHTTIHAAWRQEEEFACPVDDCSYVGKTEQALSLHNSRTHAMKRFVCHVDGCEYAAATKAGLDYHYEARHDPTIFHCNDCGFTSQTQSGVRLHWRVKHGMLPIPCDVKGCGYATLYPHVWRRHMRVMHGEEAPRHALAGRALRPKRKRKRAAATKPAVAAPSEDNATPASANSTPVPTNTAEVEAPDVRTMDEPATCERTNQNAVQPPAEVVEMITKNEAMTNATIAAPCEARHVTPPEADEDVGTKTDNDVDNDVDNNVDKEVDKDADSDAAVVRAHAIPTCMYLRVPSWRTN